MRGGRVGFSNAITIDFLVRNYLNLYFISLNRNEEFGCTYFFLFPDGAGQATNSED